MMSLCQDNAKMPAEGDDPQFLQKSLAEHFSFLPKSQKDLAENCALDFSSACPGGHGPGCKEKLKPALQEIAGFYNLQGRLHDEISSLQNEIKYSDQLLASGGHPSNERVCSHAYEDLKADCATKACDGAQLAAASELENVTTELLAVAKKIEALEVELQNLKLAESQSHLGHELNSDYVAPIKKLTQQIAFLKAQYPMAQGRASKKNWQTNKPQTQSAAVIAQLQENRGELAKRLSQLEVAANCSHSSSCEFKSLKETASTLPKFAVRNYFAEHGETTAQIVSMLRLNDFQCRIEQGAINKDLNWLAATTVINVGLTVATFGASAVSVLARAGEMLSETTTAAGTTRVALKVTAASGAVAADTYWLQDGVRNAIRECNKTHLQKGLAENKLSANSPTSTKVCSAQQFSRAYRDTQACITDAVFAALGGAPFLQALKLFKPAPAISQTAETRLMPQLENAQHELPTTREAEHFKSRTVARSDGRNFDEITHDGALSQGQEAPLTRAYVHKYPNFARRFGFEFGEGSRTRPADSKTINGLIEDFNKTSPEKEKITVRFYDDWSPNGVSRDEFVKRWADGDGLPFNQKSADTHFHDLGVHGIPGLTLTSEITKRSQHNYKVIIELLESREFRDKPGLKKQVVEPPMTAIINFNRALAVGREARHRMAAKLDWPKNESEGRQICL